MAKLLRFAFYSAMLLSIAQQGSAQQLVYNLYSTITGAGAKNGTSWREAIDSTRFQITINSAATSVAANTGDGGLVWSEITSSS